MMKLNQLSINYTFISAAILIGHSREHIQAPRTFMDRIHHLGEVLQHFQSLR